MKKHICIVIFVETTHWLNKTNVKINTLTVEDDDVGTKITQWKGY